MTKQRLLGNNTCINFFGVLFFFSFSPLEIKGQVKTNGDLPDQRKFLLMFYSPVLSSVEPELNERPTEDKFYCRRADKRTAGFNNRLRNMINVFHCFNALFNVGGGTRLLGV